MRKGLWTGKQNPKAAYPEAERSNQKFNLVFEPRLKSWQSRNWQKIEAG